MNIDTYKWFYKTDNQIENEIWRTFSLCWSYLLEIYYQHKKDPSEIYINDQAYIVYFNTMSLKGKSDGEVYNLVRIKEIPEHVHILRQEVNITGHLGIFYADHKLIGDVGLNKTYICLKDIFKSSDECNKLLTNELFSHTFRLPNSISVISSPLAKPFKERIVSSVLQDSAFKVSNKENVFYREIIDCMNKDNLIRMIIYLFTLNGSLYKRINSFLQNYRTKSGSIHLIALHACLSYTSQFNDLTKPNTTDGHYILYKGVRLDKQILRLSYLTNMIISEDFIVTTYDKNEAALQIQSNDDGKINCIFGFYIPKDKPYLFSIIEKYSIYPNEKQVIIYDKCVFLVKKVIRKGWTYYFKMNLVSECDAKYDDLKFTDSNKLEFLDDRPRDDRTNCIIEAIKLNKNLTILDLNYIIAPQDITRMVNMFKFNRNVKNLYLGYNGLKDNAFKHISNILKNSRLAELVLRNNNNTTVGIQYLINPLIINKSLGQLELVKSNIQPKEAKLLADYIKESKVLKYLDLENNTIDDEGVKYLSEALMTNNSIRILMLSGNRIKFEGAKYLSDALAINTSIRSLFLNNNMLYEQGAIELTRGLLINRTVSDISLSHNVIYQEGARALAQVIENNSNIQVMDLSNNPFGNVGVAYLRTALETNECIEVLFDNDEEAIPQRPIIDDLDDDDIPEIPEI
jgi:hypothetical protein